MKIKGGGGTDHEVVYEHLMTDKKYRNSQLLVCLTDGFTSFPPKNIYPFDTIWVLTKNSCDKKDIPFGRVIKIEE